MGSDNLTVKMKRSLFLILTLKITISSTAPAINIGFNIQNCHGNSTCEQNNAGGTQIEIVQTSLITQSCVGGNCKQSGEDVEQNCVGANCQQKNEGEGLCWGNLQSRQCRW